MSLRILVAGLLIACSDREPHEAPRPPRLETEITRALTGRFGVPVDTRCGFIGAIALGCRAQLADGTRLPILVRHHGSAIDWRIEGPVVDTRPVAAHILDMLSDLGVAQTVDCGPAVIRWKRDERLACKLSGGGAAFVDIGSDGATSFELALDQAAAAARGGPANDRDLVRISRGLERLDGDEVDEPDEPRDGGTANKE